MRGMVFKQPRTSEYWGLVLAGVPLSPLTFMTKVV